MTRQAREDIGEPGTWIDVIELAGLDERLDGGGALTAAVGTGEGPVVPADGNAAQGPLGGIVREAGPAVVEEADHRRPALQAVLDRWLEGALTSAADLILAMKPHSGKTG